MNPTQSKAQPVEISFGQQRLWLRERSRPGDPLHHLPLALLLEGPLDASVLERSLQAIISRHDVLRLVIKPDGAEPKAAVAPASELRLQAIETFADNDKDLREQVQRRLDEEMCRAFDLNQDALLRHTLLRFSPDCHVLLLVFHRLAADEVSLYLLVRELAVHYRAFASQGHLTMSPLRKQFAEYAQWQRRWLESSAATRQLEYWRKQLIDAPPLLDLPTDRVRPPTRSGRIARVDLNLDRDLTVGLKRLQRQCKCTFPAVVIAAVETLLMRYAAREDIVVGLLANNRSQGYEDLIGPFSNFLTIRNSLTSDHTFPELLRHVQNALDAAYTHRDLPFGKVVQELNRSTDPSHHPVFQTLITILDDVPAVAAAGLTIRLLEMDYAYARHDLGLRISESNNGLRSRIEYATDLFDQPTIARMCGHLLTMLRSLANNRKQGLASLPLLPANERQQVLVDWNNTQRDYQGNACLHELFEAQVAASPDSVALVCQDATLTYRDLNGRANRLAHHLGSLGIGPEKLVGICMKRGWQMVAAMLAVLKSGGAYVPLDPTYPRERLEFMLNDTRVPVLLTDIEVTAELTGVSNCQLVRLDGDWKQFAHLSPDNPASGVTERNLAYVIYTSGSTGRPKGVAIEHRSPVTLVHWAHERFSPQELAGVLFATSICFDLSIFELFVPLARGGTVVLAENLLHLPMLTASSQVTLINTVPSVMAELLRMGHVPASVRTVCLAGEPLSRELVKQIYALGHVKKVYDLYGPTEDTTYSTCALRRRDGPRTIGRPIANTQLYILDAHRQPVPIGVVGEIYLGGAGQARGYLNRPDLTDERFVLNPFGGEASSRLYKTGDLARYRPDGTIEFLGRADHQVKIRGFRIELGEIEAAIRRHRDVEACVVVPWRARADDVRLVAYVVPKQEAPKADELRRFLKESLPDHMLPSFFMSLPALPLTPTGKVNRKALPIPESSVLDAQQTVVAARSETEMTIASIWAEVLGVGQIGMNDNFFELGGHSLLATQVLSKLRDALEVELPLVSVFEAPTVAELSAGIESGRWGSKRPLLLPIQPLGDKPPLFLVHGAGGGLLWGYQNLAARLGQDRPIYSFQARGHADVERLLTMEDIAARYVKELLALRPHGPYYLGGYCLGGNIAYEMACRLSDQGEKVALLVLIDADTREYERVTWWHPLFLPRFLLNSCYWINDFLQLQAGQQIEFAKRKLRVMGRKVVQRLRRHETAFDLEDFIDLTLFQNRDLDLWRVHLQAFDQHEPRPYPGRVTLLRTRGQPFVCSFQPNLGWGSLAMGGVDIQFVPGAHEKVFLEPNVRLLADVLKSCLDRADAANRSDKRSTVVAA